MTIEKLKDYNAGMIKIMALIYLILLIQGREAIGQSKFSNAVFQKKTSSRHKSNFENSFTIKVNNIDFTINALVGARITSQGATS